jgi:hypothetical protein
MEIWTSWRGRAVVGSSWGDSSCVEVLEDCKTVNKSQDQRMCGVAAIANLAFFRNTWWTLAIQRTRGGEAS